jgi:hypothetical protein
MQPGGQEWSKGITDGSFEEGVGVSIEGRFAHEGYRTDRRYELGIHGAILQDNKLTGQTAARGASLSEDSALQC